MSCVGIKSYFTAWIIGIFTDVSLYEEDNKRDII